MMTIPLLYVVAIFDLRTNGLNLLELMMLVSYHWHFTFPIPILTMPHLWNITLKHQVMLQKQSTSLSCYDNPISFLFVLALW